MTRPATPGHPLVHAYLSEQRWFAGKSGDFAVAGVRRLARLPGEEPTVTVELVTVREPETGQETVYQLPLASYTAPQTRLDHALVGEWTDAELGAVYAYDAAHDRDAMARYLEAFADPDTADGGALAFHRIGDHDLDRDARATLFSGEQSNSSVAFGDDALLKIFRRVAPGTNPDIEVHRALTEAGSSNVARLFGWLDGRLDSDDGLLQLAMLQEFLRTASDGWALALASVRNLFAEADLHAEEVGGDFEGESHRLGSAIAQVHGVLAAHFPVAERDGAAIRAAMQTHLASAAAEVPELADHVDRLRAIYAALPDAPVTAQRVHGDLHLGQTLRTSLGWKLVDFEGEPERPLAERTLPDSAWRDVAGMLRSFDYAARSVELDVTGSDDEERQRAYRGVEWVVRNSAALLDGYAETAGPVTEQARALIRAYEADKAVYEVVYEARNRPHWMQIPLGAIARLTGANT